MVGCWPPPGDSLGVPWNHCWLTCRPFLSRQCCHSVTLPHCLVNGPLQWKQVDTVWPSTFGSNAIVNVVNANYVASRSLRALIASTCIEHSLSKAVLTALHHSSTSRATGLVPGEVQKCSATPPFSCGTYCYRTTTIDRVRMVRMYITLNTK